MKSMSGYFDNNKNEYVIAEMFPRRERLNYLWNETTVCLCNQFGGGNAWTSFGEARRQIEKGDRNIYIKDRTTGECYSANRNYCRLPFSLFQSRVGLGYHTVESSYKGLFVRFELLVPTEGNAVQYRITLKNETDQDKELDMYFCNQPQADLSGHESYGDADYDEEICGLDFAHEGFAVSSDYQHVYLASEKKLIRSFFAFAAALLIKPQALFFAPVLVYSLIGEVWLDDGFKLRRLIKYMLKQKQLQKSFHIQKYLKKHSFLPSFFLTHHRY